jgi:hypothetical protein
MSRVFKPKLQTMDNEASSALKSHFTENEMTSNHYPHIVTGATPLSVPSGLSRNTLWQALSSVDTDLPMNFWDLLLPQT